MGRMPCFPVGGETIKTLYQRYLGLAEEYPNVIFGRRLGAYRNYSMAQAIAAARELAARALEKK